MEGLHGKKKVRENQVAVHQFYVDVLSAFVERVGSLSLLQSQQLDSLQ